MSVRGIRVPVFFQTDDKKLGSAFRSKRFEIEFKPEIRQEKLVANLFVDAYTSATRLAPLNKADTRVLHDEVSVEELLASYPDLHDDAQLLLMGGVPWEGREHHMMNADGDHVKARALILKFNEPEALIGMKRKPIDRMPQYPPRGVIRLMVPFYRLHQALTNEGRVLTHRSGTARCQGLGLVTKQNDLGDGVMADTRLATAFAVWRLPFIGKPKFKTDEFGKALVDEDGRKYVLIDERNPPIVVVLDSRCYRALHGAVFPNMSTVMEPLLKTVFGSLETHTDQRMSHLANYSSEGFSNPLDREKLEAIQVSHPKKEADPEASEIDSAAEEPAVETSSEAGKAPCVEA